MKVTKDLISEQYGNIIEITTTEILNTLEVVNH